MADALEGTKRYLLASDFDQTLSFNDSGIILSELIGASRFEEKVAGLARINLVQQGGELAYLLRHDPDFRCVRREHLQEAGRRVRLKKNVDLFARLLANGIEGYQFEFYVISAAPEDVVHSALEGIVPKDHIFGTKLDFDPVSGEIRAIRRVPAGHGKVAVLEELQHQLDLAPNRTVYVGDGSSDVHVMLHVNSYDGFTIAVSEARNLTRIARRTVLSDDGLSVLVPVLEGIAGWGQGRIRDLFEPYGLRLEGWERSRTDWVTFRESSTEIEAGVK